PLFLWSCRRFEPRSLLLLRGFHRHIGRSPESRLPCSPSSSYGRKKYLRSKGKEGESGLIEPSCHHLLFARVLLMIMDPFSVCPPPSTSSLQSPVPFPGRVKVNLPVASVTFSAKRAPS